MPRRPLRPAPPSAASLVPLSLVCLILGLLLAQTSPTRALPLRRHRRTPEPAAPLPHHTAHLGGKPAHHWKPRHAAPRLRGGRGRKVSLCYRRVCSDHPRTVCHGGHACAACEAPGRAPILAGKAGAAGKSGKQSHPGGAVCNVQKCKRLCRLRKYRHCVLVHFRCAKMKGSHASGAVNVTAKGGAATGTARIGEAPMQENGMPRLTSSSLPEN